MDNENKTPMPPSMKLFIPLPFWIELIAYLDKRVEIVATNSGYGVIEMSVKLQAGKVYEVDFEEKTRLRDILEKAGEKGFDHSPKQSPPSEDEEKPTL